MKRIILIAFLIFPFLGISQSKKPIDGFFGIKFGSDSATVKAIVLAKGGIIDKKTSKNNYLVFNNITFASWKNVTLYVKFIDNKAYSGIFGFIEDLEPKTIIENYKKLIREINKDYGPGKELRTFKDPFHDGDGRELEALATHNAEYQTIWEGNKHQNLIQAMIFVGETLMLTYVDSALFVRAEQLK
jgi:hypothetical protein